MSNTYLTDLKNKIDGTAGLAPLEREKELRNLYCGAIKEIISCFSSGALALLCKSMKEDPQLGSYAYNYAVKVIREQIKSKVDKKLRDLEI